MMGIGAGEMILIAGIALVVIGPERFPEFAKIIVRTFRDLRGYVDDVKGELRKELQPVKKEIDDVSRYKPEDYIDALTDGSEESDYDHADDPYGYGSEYGTAETQTAPPSDADTGDSESTPSVEGTSSSEDASTPGDASSAEGTTPSDEGAPSGEGGSDEHESQEPSDDTDWTEFVDLDPEKTSAPDDTQEHAAPAPDETQDTPAESPAPDEPDPNTPPDRLDG